MQNYLPHSSASDKKLSKLAKLNFLAGAGNVILYSAAECNYMHFLRNDSNIQKALNPIQTFI